MEKDTFEKLKIQLYSALETLRSQGQTVTTELLDKFVDIQTSFLTVTTDEKSEIRSYLESHMYIQHDHNGYAIIDDDDKVFPMVAPGAPIESVFDADDVKNK